MLNFTLTVSAAPELLAAVSDITNAIIGTKKNLAPFKEVVQIPMAEVSAATSSAESYTQEQLVAAAIQIVDAGRRQELLSLLQSFDVQAIPLLPKERYGEFAVQLKALGALGL